MPLTNDGNTPQHPREAAQLSVYRPSETTSAWRVTEPDAPGLFALISDGQGLTIPPAPETDDLTIAIFDEAIEETLGSIEVDGREGLNRWYLQNVGHMPDKEPDGPRPIIELINDVACHLMLRFYEADQDAVRAGQPQPAG
ncbi:hypothetical protein ACFPOU_08345 [Massilia jejuensis]|uniref:Uncharacterized protein n=1 Tax=Massilia jejuensis TaxID=648894 RepID=A0ABW0PGG2_9BURK